MEKKVASAVRLRLVSAYRLSVLKFILEPNRSYQIRDFDSFVEIATPVASLRRLFVMGQFSMTGALVAVLCSAAIVQADLVLTGGNELIGAAGGINEFGNLSGQGYTPPVNAGFPSTGSASYGSRSLGFSQLLVHANWRNSRT